jgi:hypothetical protein
MAVLLSLQAVLVLSSSGPEGSNRKEGLRLWNQAQNPAFNYPEAAVRRFPGRPMPLYDVQHAQQANEYRYLHKLPSALTISNMPSASCRQ